MKSTAEKGVSGQPEDWLQALTQAFWLTASFSVALVASHLYPVKVKTHSWLGTAESEWQPKFMPKKSNWKQGEDASFPMPICAVSPETSSEDVFDRTGGTNSTRRPPEEGRKGISGGGPTRKPLENQNRW